MSRACKRLRRLVSRIQRRESQDQLALRAPGWLLAPNALELWAMRRWAQSPVLQLPLP